MMVFILLCLRAHSLDSEIYLNITCDCKLFSVSIFLFVISHVSDIYIILHIISNVDCTHLIPIFHFGFPIYFINCISLCSTLQHTYLELKVQIGGTLSDTLPSNQFTISREKFIRGNS